MHDQGDDRDNEENMNQASGDVECRPTKEPGDKKTIKRIKNHEKNMAISFSIEAAARAAAVSSESRSIRQLGDFKGVFDWANTQPTSEEEAPARRASRSGGSGSSRSRVGSYNVRTLAVPPSVAVSAPAPPLVLPRSLS
jgi:hypothetical protein